MKTPVLFIVFNRPHTTKKVFDAIRNAKPTLLYVAADGPRPGRNEEELCREVREAATSVDWPCEVKTLFQETNKGLRQGITEAITWFLEAEGEGIIFEDDTLPVPEFFPFCEELLERYRHDERVNMVGGTNLNYPVDLPQYSYFFSPHVPIWGWATWLRTWEKRGTFKKYRQEVFRKDGVLDVIYPDIYENIVRRRDLLDAEAGRISSWAYEFQADCLLHSSLSIVPTQNLITNIGFGEGGTNTQDSDSYFANLKAEELTFPLKHPDYFVRSRVYEDHRFYRNQRLDELMSYGEMAKLFWEKTRKKIQGVNSIRLPE